MIKTFLPDDKKREGTKELRLLLFRMFKRYLEKETDATRTFFVKKNSLLMWNELRLGYINSLLLKMHQHFLQFLQLFAKDYHH